MKKESTNTSSLAHTTWNCKWHIVFVPTYINDIPKKCNKKFAYRNREFWCKGYYVDTVGKNTKGIKRDIYITGQLKRAKERAQISMFDP